MQVPTMIRAKLEALVAALTERAQKAHRAQMLALQDLMLQMMAVEKVPAKMRRALVTGAIKMKALSILLRILRKLAKQKSLPL